MKPKYEAGRTNESETAEDIELHGVDDFLVEDGALLDARDRPYLSKGLRVLFLVGVVFVVGIFLGRETAPTSGEPTSTPSIAISNILSSPPSSTQAPQSGPGAPPPSTQVPPSLTYKFTREMLKDSKTKAAGLRDMMTKYYSPHENILDDGWAINPASGDFAQGRERLVYIFARALVNNEQDTFRIGAIGSSVAAGHDNCNYDSYEKQLFRTFEPVIQPAGLKLEVLNAGEGGKCGDSYQNQVMCVTQNLHPEMDIVHYSWTYFEHSAVQVNHENIIRWALTMPHQPPVHIFNTGGKARSCEVGDRKLHQAYSKYGFNSICLEGALYSGGLYGGKKWGVVGDGYHNVTRYGEAETDPKRKESLGVVFRNWHPGPLGFQTIADSMAFHYADALIKAIDLVLAALDAGKDLAKEWPSPSKTPIFSSDMPTPIYCDPRICAVDEPPKCTSFEKPAYGWYGAKIVRDDDDLSPYVAETNAWKTTVLGNEQLIPSYERVKYSDPDSSISCEHLDHCGFVSSDTAADGYLTFKLPKMNLGIIIICGYGKSDTSILKSPDLEIYFDGKLLKNGTFIAKYPLAKCTKILDAFPPNMENKGGHLYLGLKITADKLSHPIQISQIITM